MNNRHKFIVGLAIVTALFAGFWAGEIVIDQEMENPAPVSYVMTLDTPQKLAIPALQQANDNPFDIASLTGQWSILFFGYTNCPDICPATLNTLAQAKKEYTRQYSAQTDAVFPQVVLISVDPQRDNVKLLADYVQYFDEEFIGVTGEEKLLRAIAVQTYANFIAEPVQENGRYLVNHTVNLALINPDAELVAVLSPPHTVESILEVLQQFNIKL